MKYQEPTLIARWLSWLPRRLAKIAYRAARKFAPYTRWGDRLVFDVDFLSVHGRLPRRSGQFNDQLYQLFTSERILEPERQFSCDKYLGKIYAAGILGEDLSVPTLGVIETPEDLHRFTFPTHCAIKATHASGLSVIKSAATHLDLANIETWLSTNYYNRNREINYRYLRPRIIVEPVIFDGMVVDDYKIFCYKGKPRCILYVSDRSVDFARIFMSLDWVPLPIAIGPKQPDPLPPRPQNLQRMLDAAEKLARPFDIVRIDFFSSGDQMYLGEISHVHVRAMERFGSERDEEILSETLFGDK